MKVEITIRKGRAMMDELAKAFDVGIERITQYEHTISFETEQPSEWLTKERRIAFEEQYNKEMSNGDEYFIVEKISLISK